MSRDVNYAHEAGNEHSRTLRKPGDLPNLGHVSKNGNSHARNEGIFGTPFCTSKDVEMSNVVVTGRTWNFGASCQVAERNQGSPSGFDSFEVILIGGCRAHMEMIRLSSAAKFVGKWPHFLTPTLGHSVRESISARWKLCRHLRFAGRIKR